MACTLHLPDGMIPIWHILNEKDAACMATHSTFLMTPIWHILNEKDAACMAYTLNLPDDDPYLAHSE